MRKKVSVVSYDPEWKNVFKVHEEELRNALSDNCVNVYHVGSTSVPGLCAKPVVDIMCVVGDLKAAAEVLPSLGYEAKGEFNLPLRLFFSRKVPNDVHIHVVKEDSGEISWNLTFQDYLRENSDARDLYAKTKLDLIKENPNGFKMIEGLFSEYTVKKAEVILDIAKKAGFDGSRFVIVANHNEIEAYKKLLNLEKIDFSNKNIFRLCLYKGVEIVAAACVKFDRADWKACIKAINASSPEYEQTLKGKIEEWAEFHGLDCVDRCG